MSGLLKAVCAAICVATLLSGCVTVTSPEITPEQAAREAGERVDAFNPRHSVAWNLSYLTQKPQDGLVEDIYIPDSLYEQARLKPKTEPPVSVDPGKHPVRGLSLSSDSEVIDIFGFIDRTEGYSPAEIISFLYRKLLIGFHRASSEIGFTATRITYPEMGVADWTGTRNGTSPAKMSFRMLNDAPHFCGGCLSATSIVRKPAWLAPNREYAWLVGKGPLMWFRITNLKSEFKTEAEGREAKIEFINRLATYLPDGMYIYRPWLKNRAGEWHPHAVLSNSTTHWFVMPESARNLQKPN